MEWEVAGNTHSPPDILQEMTDKVLKYDRDDCWEVPYVDLHLFKERLAGNPAAPPAFYRHWPGNTRRTCR